MDEHPARAGSYASHFLTSPSELLGQVQESTISPRPTTDPVHHAAPLPANEVARLEELNRLGVLDSDPEQRFDDITQLVCSIFKVPIAIVSLVDKERQWFKSCVGLNCSQTDRKSSFCAWTLVPKNPEVLVVPDATEDARFQSNPLVLNDPNIRFYAGAPLVTAEGVRLGSLCIIDRQQKQFDAESCRLLCNFAEVVVQEILKYDARAALQQKSLQAPGFMRSVEAGLDGISLADMSTPDWGILFHNDSWLRITGLSRDEVKGSSIWQLFAPAGQTREQAMQQCQAAIAKQQAFTLHLLRGRPSSVKSRQLVIAHFKSAATEHLNSAAPLVGVPGQVQWKSGEAGHLYFVTVQRDEPDIRGSDQVLETPRSRNQIFEDVQLGPLLGQGGYGKVYRGLWNKTPVAVKIIQHTGLLPGSENADSIKAQPSPRVQRQSSDLSALRPKRQDRPQQLQGNVEGILTLQLSHLNVVHTFRAVTIPAQETHVKSEEQLFETWLLLEYCDKGSLQNAVDQGWFRTDQHGHVNAQTKPNMKAIRATALEIAAALAYLHGLNLLHGDLTGGNILLSSSNVNERGFCAKVADFGLSRTVGSEPIDVNTYGTVTHMPPELLTTGKLSKSVDVYAFGVLLWEMYTGQRPWSGLNPMQIIFHLTLRKKKLQFPAHTPAQLQALGTRCMSSDVSERPNFDEILQLVDELDVES
ncbi:hypothetical protein WJX82_002554 [Trebouxia sp. C0006]